MNNILKVTLALIFSLAFFACNKETIKITEPVSNKIILNKQYDLNEIIEKLSIEYKNRQDVIVAIQLEFMSTNDKLKVLKKSEIEGFAAIMLLSSYNYNPNNLFKKSSGGCTKKDIRKGKCYEIRCIASDGESTTSRCTSGVLGSCISTVSACFKGGGCVEACKVAPTLLYLPEDAENDKPSEIILFPGEY